MQVESSSNAYEKVFIIFVERRGYVLHICSQWRASN